MAATPVGDLLLAFVYAFQAAVYRIRLARNTMQLEIATITRRPCWRGATCRLWPVSRPKKLLSEQRSLVLICVGQKNLLFYIIDGFASCTLYLKFSSFRT